MAIPLQTFQHKAGLTFYLDTSAVMPLALAEAGQLPAREVSRRARVEAFVRKATASSSRVIASVLAFEEIGAKTRNTQQNPILVRETARSWREYAQADPARAAADRAVIQAYVVKMLEHTASALGKLGVTVEQPVVSDAEDAGRRLRKSHRVFMSAYQDIDSMDALHIAVGGLLGCKHFISFDGGWDSVTEITLLS